MTRYDSQHKARTRASMLAEAAAALCAHGPDGVSVITLMGRIGLTHGAFYGHFKSKDELVAESISVMFASANAWLTKLTEHRPVRPALCDYVDFYLSDEHVADIDTGCALPAMAADVSRLPPHARQAFTQGATQLHDAFAALLVSAGFQSSDAAQLSRSVFSEMAGAVLIARAVDTRERAGIIREASRKAVKVRLGLL